jgi:hypothetical protein
MALLQGTVNKAYISSIDLMDEREILDQVLDTTSEDATIVDIFELTGRMVQTDQVQYNHFTNDYVFRSGTISAIDATNNGEDSGATNETAVITLTADEELPIVGESAMFVNNRIGRVTAVNTGTRVVTVSPLSDADADTLSPVGDTIATTQKVIFFSGSYGEGSDDPSVKRPSFKRSQNQIQIFKTAREITDVQKVATIEVVYDGKRFILYKMQHDALMEHRGKIAFQMLVGKKGTTTDADGNTVWLTQGLRQYILNGDGTVLTTGGVDVPLTTTITLANFRTMSRALDKRGAGPEYWLWVGGDLCADLDDVFTQLDTVKNGGILYNSWGMGDGKKRALDLGVDSLHLYGRTFHKKLIKAYDHPEVFGATGFEFGSEGYLIPGGKTKIDYSGTTIDALRTRYMSNDGTDFGKWNEVLTGKLAPTPTNTKSVLHISYQSIMGLEACGIRQFGIFSKA